MAELFFIICEQFSLLSGDVDVEYGTIMSWVETMFRWALLRAIELSCRIPCKCVSMKGRNQV